MGGFFDGGFLVGVGDGSVRFLSAETPVDQLKAMISPAGGEIISDFDQPAAPLADVSPPKPLPTPGLKK